MRACIHVYVRAFACANLSYILPKITVGNE